MPYWYPRLYEEYYAAGCAATGELELNHFSFAGTSRIVTPFVAPIMIFISSNIRRKFSAVFFAVALAIADVDGSRISLEPIPIVMRLEMSPAELPRWHRPPAYRTNSVNNRWPRRG